MMRKHRAKQVRILVGVLISLLSVVIGETGRTRASVDNIFIVNSDADSNSMDDVLTLREAILVAEGTLTGAFTDAEKAQLAGCAFAPSGANWMITGDCGAGVEEDIFFEGDRTIALGNSLPELGDDGTAIIAVPGQVVKIDGQSAAPSILTITGSSVKLIGLRIYGSSAGWPNVWITGLAEGVVIANSVIGDDDPSPGDCGQSPHSHSGIFIHATGAIPSGARAWIYGNVIECHEGDPGQGIRLFDSGHVQIGQNSLGTAGEAERNNIGWNAGDGIYIAHDMIGEAGFHTIRNSTIHDNGGDGVEIGQSGLNAIYGNAIEYNSHSGVHLHDGAWWNAIGCGEGLPRDEISSNRIGSNGEYGIRIDGAATGANVIACNWIGLSDDGLSAAPNEYAGVYITDGASGNIVEWNVISGNRGSGVWIESSDDNFILGNTIGTNTEGTAALPNELGGIALTHGAGGNIIGDPADSDSGNVISGNVGNGIDLFKADSGNEINHNIIGLSADETSALGNALHGISVILSDGNDIGEAGPQLIAANGGAGIWISDSSRNTLGEGNIIRDNAGAGVALHDAQETLAHALTVTGNGGAGVVVTGDGSAGIRILMLALYGNGGLPIDLANDGHTGNDPEDADTGPNALLNYPAISSADSSTVGGTTCAGCSVYIFEAKGDPSRPGGGGDYLATVTADAEGNWSYTLPDGLTAANLALAAADETGNTSELSPRPVTFVPTVWGD